MIPPDRVYADPGDRMAGRYDPPRLCVVVTQWGPGGGPRNVAVRYLDNGQVTVIPFARRLRRAPCESLAKTCGVRLGHPGSDGVIMSV